jgi:ATP-dependent Clp protease ATP-binding subunit ClpC
MWWNQHFCHRKNPTMFSDFSDRAKQAMQRAGEEACRLNHQYIGTEHILLGLIAEDSGSAANVLDALGITATAIQNGVEAFVQRGSGPASSTAYPLTPRSERVIELARDEARASAQQLDTEHLLVALLDEPDGVASRVLHLLGVKPDELRAEALRTRISLMKLVERSVRPVRASIVRKRKMREELFAHLTVIFDEELARIGDPHAALAQAAQRFGEPAELARELDSSLPSYERISAYVERWVQYRAPETAARYAFRLAVHTFWTLAAVLGLVTCGVLLVYGWIDAVRSMLHVFAAIVLFTPLLQFAVGLTFVKLRDAMWGAFGSRRSAGRVLLFSAVIAIVAHVYLMGVAVVARSDFRAVLDANRWGGTIGLTAAVVLLAIAYFTGRDTIRDTQWAQLDVAD